jgi:hypothetical protein
MREKKFYFFFKEQIVIDFPLEKVDLMGKVFFFGML